MASSIQIHPVTTRRDRSAFVKFPWRVYKDDPNWVPPLISDQLEYLDPTRGPFFKHADVALFLARQGRRAAGTIAAFIDDLSADSIQLVDLMLHLEEEGIAIPMEAAWDVHTVGDAYRLYQEHAA